jgi:hypothetical protein
MHYNLEKGKNKAIRKGKLYLLIPGFIVAPLGDDSRDFIDFIPQNGTVGISNFVREGRR